MDLSTTFEDFASTVTTDKRSQALDAGNIKLTYKTVSIPPPPLILFGECTVAVWS